MSQEPYEGSQPVGILAEAAESASLSGSFIVRTTIADNNAITVTSTTNTARIAVAPRKPAAIGLTAIPVSDALVSTPKPVPCAPDGITDPAAV